MPRNGKWDLIWRLKFNVEENIFTFTSVDVKSMPYFTACTLYSSEPGSSVGIANDYGLNGLGTESR